MRTVRVFAVVGLSALTSCASLNARLNAWQHPMPPNVQTRAVAVNLTGLTSRVLPPANTIVTVHRSGGFGGKDLFAAFTAALRERGFGVADNGGVTVNYSASEFSSAILLWVQIRNEVVVRAYQPSENGSLIPVSPLSLGEEN